MIHSILFTSYLGFIMAECQCVGRRIYFRDDFDETFFCQLLQIDKFFFCIESVTCRESGISIRFQAESCISLVPVLFKILFKSIIVQMNLQCVHFVVCHDFHVIAQIRHRNEFSSAINHKSTHGIVGIITDFTFGKSQVFFVLFGYLQQGTCSPIYTDGFGGGQLDSVGNANGVSFLP